jgi:hypothetical protein
MSTLVFGDTVVMSLAALMPSILGMSTSAGPSRVRFRGRHRLLAVGGGDLNIVPVSGGFLNSGEIVSRHRRSID